MSPKIITSCFAIFMILDFIAALACGPNETEVDCPTTCESDYCPKHEGQSQCPTPVTCPPPACKCVFDYRRADNGTCIPTEQCPPFNCSRPKEGYSACPPLCPDDCAHAAWDGQCPMTFGFIGIAVPCSPQCRCKRLYWRRNGTCVPFKDCH